MSEAIDEYPGLTRTSCPLECTEERCIVTGIGICGHPCKGGIQSPLNNDPKIMDRYWQMRKAIQVDDVVKRYA